MVDDSTSSLLVKYRGVSDYYVCSDQWTSAFSDAVCQQLQHASVCFRLFIHTITHIFQLQSRARAVYSTMKFAWLDLHTNLGDFRMLLSHWHVTLPLSVCEACLIGHKQSLICSSNRANLDPVCRIVFRQPLTSRDRRAIHSRRTPQHDHGLVVHSIRYMSARNRQTTWNCNHGQPIDTGFWPSCKFSTAPHHVQWNKN